MQVYLGFRVNLCVDEIRPNLNGTILYHFLVCFETGVLSFLNTIQCKLTCREDIEGFNDGNGSVQHDRHDSKGQWPY